MSRAAENRQNQVEIVRNHYNDRVNIWRPTSAVDSFGLTVEGPYVLIYTNIPIQWVNRRTFTQQVGVGYMPDPKHDSTDEVWLVGQLDVRARDVLDLATPDSPGYGFCFSIQGSPEPFNTFFKQVGCIIRWIQRPAGVLRLGQ